MPPGTAAAIAAWNGSRCEANTSPGVSRRMTCFSLAKSFDSSEYAGDTGA